MGIRMTLNVGDKVSARFYRLALLDDSGGELFVPVDKFRDLKMRALLDRSEIPKLLGHLKTRAGVIKDLGIAKNWRQRELDNLKLFSSGSIFELAHIVESLTQLNGTKILASHDRDTLYRARKLLICEISEVMAESKTAAEARIDRVLEPGKSRLN